MKLRSGTVLLIVALGSLTRPLGSKPAVRLAPADQARLRTWFQRLGPPRSGESFGGYLARAALLQRGRPYHHPAQVDQPAGQSERPRLNLRTFDCISLIESSLAVARCGFRGTSSEPCFAREVVASRYRHGRQGDYADRLHYFSEWLSDNTRRGRLYDLAPRLGGRPMRRAVNFMSRHPQAYPALQRPEIARRIQSVEARLTRNPPTQVVRARIARVQSRLRAGDIVAIVTNVRGLPVTHAGLLVRVRGRPRLLHASRYHKKVLLDGASLTHYLHRRPERRAVLVARPLAPPMRTP